MTFEQNPFLTDRLSQGFWKQRLFSQQDNPSRHPQLAIAPNPTANPSQWQKLAKTAIIESESL
ncbi:hypothetical protein [Laspinema olomoucense]|uniref:Uncharacterized protein n=1 Tax=Laspinema olomoucense D3b TaxID=2953688 RepID=A0ABT2N6S4_9CYAN|nr:MULTISPECIES: hypothetical protein [unclassified Laspinema]MCT7974560.1 hypothetical protein [Laspinema sp. D3d]MCT7977075.1 hypothetical protein [Laspinema sp. D3b]